MFEIADSLTADSSLAGCSGSERVVEADITIAASQLIEAGPHKLVLPRRPGESRLGPRQYYYPASRTGVLPSWYCAG
jgi:hypothetical protein